MPHNRPLLAAALAALVVALVADATRPPPPVSPVTVPPAEFSAERAMRHVREIARHPRPPGSVEHARVRDYLLGQIAALGLDAHVQQTTAFSRGGGVAGRVHNVLVRVPGSAGDGQAVLLAAHYDGVGAGPAASDDGAGVAVLLETLRALVAGPPVAHDVIVLITDGEEAGLLGAGAFVRDHAWGRDVEAILNFEARGTRGRSVMFESSAGNLDIVRLLAGFGDAETSSLWTPIYRALPNDTDLSRLSALRKPALNFAFVDGVERYHTTYDDTVHIDPRSVQHHGSQALYLARRLADGPFPRPATGDAIFFRLPVVGLVVHPQAWNFFLVPLLGFAVLLASFTTRRAERGWVRSMVLGAAGTLLAGVAGAIVAALLIVIAPADVGMVGWRGAYGWAIALAAVATAGGLWTLVRRRATVGGAHLGAIAVWTVLALLAARYAPGASFLAIWPAAAAAFAAALRSTRPAARAALILEGVAVLVATVLVVPALYLVGVVGLGVLDPGALVIAFFAPMLAWLVLPLLDRLVGVQPGRFLLATFGGSLAIVLVCAIFPRPVDGVPEKSVLAYALDADRAEAWIVSPAFLSEPGSWAGELLTLQLGRTDAATALHTPADPTLAPVAPDLAARLDEHPDWIRRSFGYPYRMHGARAPAVATQGGTVEIVADSATASGRSLTLRLAAPPATLVLDIQLSGAPIQVRTVDGHSLPMAGSGQFWSLAYTAPPPEGVTIELELGPGTPVLEMMTRSAGIPPPAAPLIPPRPVGVVPALTGDVTVVHRRVRL